jgi:hypothetical protein
MLHSDNSNKCNDYLCLIILHDVSSYSDFQEELNITQNLLNISIIVKLELKVTTYLKAEEKKITSKKRMKNRIKFLIHKTYGKLSVEEPCFICYFDEMLSK